MDVAGSELLIQYRLRNSSQKEEIRNIVLVDELPPGLTVHSSDERCALTGRGSAASLEPLPAGQRDEVEISVVGDDGICSRRSVATRQRADPDR